MPPAVAVIIPAYNRARLLERAVRSVLAQTWRDFELVVVDDGSTDGTGDLLHIRDDDARLRVLRSDKNRGVSAARNAGVQATAAPWIAFLDSDDEWLPKKLSEQMRYAADHPGFRIAQTREQWIRNGTRVNPPRTHEKKESDIFAQSLDRCMITPSSVIMTRALFEECGPFNESLPACEDYDLWLRTTCRNHVGLIDNALLIRYGGHADQLSSTVPHLDRYRIQSVLDLLARDCLTSDQRTLAVRSLCKRAAIMAEGSRKHGKIEEYERYRKIVEQYS